MHLQIIFTSLLASFASAKICKTGTVTVNLSSRNAVFGNVAIPQTYLELVSFIQAANQQGRNFTDFALTGYANVGGTYKIGYQYCEPKGGLGPKGTLQFLTHGIGVDKSYWDIPYKNDIYSYVNIATKQGYATLSIDRLGSGVSSRGNPRDELQIFLEVEAIAALTKRLRAGHFEGISRSFNKVIHVGHSFGSFQTYAFASKYPNLSDAIVLTGFTMTPNFLGSFVTGANFQFANTLPQFCSTTGSSTLNNGYWVFGGSGANQFLNFHTGNFDPGLLDYVTKFRQPVTIGEFLTVGSVPVPNSFNKPVMVLTGANDIPFCGGNCYLTGDPSLPSFPHGVKANFPLVAPSDFFVHVQPNTGHAVAVHKNSTASALVVQNFLKSKNL